jgi:hypothetical protein
MQVHKLLRIAMAVIEVALLVVTLPAQISQADRDTYAATSEMAVTRNPPDVLTSEKPSVAGDELWSKQFMLGTNDGIFAITVSGTDVYVGGDFTQAGGVPANHVAKWNTVTRQWSALGSGVNNRVYAIAVSGNHVYVGGGFNYAGSLNANGLAMWDTTMQTWSLAGGVNLAHSVFSPEIRALAFDASGNLYAGGMFEHIGTLSALNIAKWSGASWSALGAGLGTNNETVYAIAASGSDVYAGGSFSYGIEHWNGAAWNVLGSGTSNSFYKSVNAIAISGSQVYVGGDFDTVTDSTNGNVTANHIAQWNTANSTWVALDTGTNASVYALTLAGGNLYAGGQFNHAGGSNARHIATWSGSAWNAVKAPSDLNDGTDQNVDALLVNGNDLYVGGSFLLAGSWQANHITRWNISAQAWYALANGLDSSVASLAVNGNDVYVGGQFQSAGGVVAHGIARWNASSNWQPLGTGMSGCVGFLCFYPTVSAILVVGQDVYVGGNFYSAGGVTAHSIARWNMIDQQWHALGGGVACSTTFCGADVYALTYDGGCVIVGGAFDSVNGTSVPAHNLAQWCGSSWNNVVYNDGADHIVETNGGVYALTWDGGYGLLYVGGSFSSPTADLFSLDYRGGVFNVGDPLNGAVRSIVVDGPSEYIGGDFTNLSSNALASYIAEQTGSSNTWLPLGNGLNGSVEGLTLQGNNLIVVGAFTSSGATGLSHVASWNGSSWSALGSGADSAVYAVAADRSFVTVGGAFQNAGGKPASYFSRWGEYRGYLPLIRK